MLLLLLVILCILSGLVLIILLALLLLRGKKHVPPAEPLPAEPPSPPCPPPTYKLPDHFGEADLPAALSVPLMDTPANGDASSAPTTTLASVDWVNAPTHPIAINPEEGQTLNLVFTPATAGEDSALLNIDSNDSASPSVLHASGRGVAKGKPRLATNPVEAISFGTTSADRNVAVQLFNVGTDDLTITDIEHDGSSDFSLDPASTFPRAVTAGGESDLTIKYHPTSNGDAAATSNIVSNDLNSPYTYGISGTGNVLSSNWLTILECVCVGLLIAGAVVGGVVIGERLLEKKGK
jgi:hypothetical protein